MRGIVHSFGASRAVFAFLTACAFVACSFPDYSITTEPPRDPLEYVCTDGLPSAAESGIDCGGGCPDCPVGEHCNSNDDCQSQSCGGGQCQAPTCEDTVKNASETDVDCGGQCDPCALGRDCKVAQDCLDGVCAQGFCKVPTCRDTVRNGSETGIDCGDRCEPCALGMGCVLSADCQSEHCSEDGTCVAPGCTDGMQNGTESDLDCGGHECSPCKAGQTCGADPDCTSEICDAGQCTAFACNDGVLNGEETDLDCGGPRCDGCGELQRCMTGSDCASDVCLSGLCVPAKATGAALAREGWDADGSDTYPDDDFDEVLDSVGGRWTSGARQYPGMWLEVDMGELQTFFSIVLTCAEEPLDNPARFDVYLSVDGTYGAPVKSPVYGGNSANGSASTASFDTAQLARYVKIVLTQDKVKWWSIDQFNVLK